MPLLEVPSGVLADRWSRRGVLGIAVVALAVSAVIGGFSTNVATYSASALFLGVFVPLAGRRRGREMGLGTPAQPATLWS